jgi:hypothetical protein
MADEEEEGYPIPKREIELGEGIIIRPRKEKKEIEEARAVAEEEIKKERAEREEMYKKVERKENGKALVYVSLAIAICSLLLSGYLFYNFMKMKNELKTIITNLESFKDSTITLRARMTNITQTGVAAIPIREAIPSISIPIPPQELTINGSMEVILPGYNFPVKVPWKGTSEISGILNIDTRNLSEERKITIRYEIPAVGEMSFKIKGEEIFTEELDRIIKSLEELSR